MMEAIYSYSPERRQTIEEVKKRYRRREKLENEISRKTIQIEHLEYKQEGYFYFEDEYKEIQVLKDSLRKEIKEMRAEVEENSNTKLSSKYGFTNDVINRIGKGQYFIDGDN